MAIEKLPSGKYRAVVRHAGAKRAGEAVATIAEARMPEAKLRLAMGGSTAPLEHSAVGVVDHTADMRLRRPVDPDH